MLLEIEVTYNMKYAKCIVLFILSLCLLCECAKGENNLKIKMSLPDKKVTELVSKTYNDTQLTNIVQYEGTMAELNTQYPIECIRKTGDFYRVSYLGNSSIVVLIFDNAGNKICGDVHGMILKQSDFTSLVNGQSLEDVQRIDPYGEYLFLYTGRNDIPRISNHYTKDGYLITIEYDKDNNILSLRNELI